MDTVYLSDESSALPEKNVVTSLQPRLPTPWTWKRAEDSSAGGLCWEHTVSKGQVKIRNAVTLPNSGQFTGRIRRGTAGCLRCGHKRYGGEPAERLWAGKKQDECAPLIALGGEAGHPQHTHQEGWPQQKRMKENSNRLVAGTSARPGVSMFLRLSAPDV